MDTIIGRNIKFLRTERNMTQEQLADVLNISNQAVSKWENGVSVPDTMMMPKIAYLFEITIDELYKNDIACYHRLADRYINLYEMNHTLDSFLRAENESRKVLESGIATNEDIRGRGLLFEWATYDCAKEAEKLYDQILKSNQKDDSYYMVQRQLVYFRSCIGKNDINIAEFEQLIQEEPNDINNYFPLIMAYEYDKRYQYAWNLVSTCLLQEPNNAFVCHYAGNVSQHLGNFDDAFQYWEKSFSLDPELLANQYAKAELYEKIYDFNKAIITYQEIEKWMDLRGKDIDIISVRKEIDRIRKILLRDA